MKFKELLDLINKADNIKVFVGSRKYQGNLEDDDFYLSLKPLYEKEVYMITSGKDFFFNKDKYEGITIYTEVMLNE